MNQHECMDEFLRLEKYAGNIADNFYFDDTPLWQYLRMAFFDSFYYGARKKDIDYRPDIMFDLDANFYDMLSKEYELLSTKTGHKALIFTRGYAYTQKSCGKAYDPYLDQVYIDCEKNGLNPLKLKVDGNEIRDPLIPLIELPLAQVGKKNITIGNIAKNPYYKEYVNLSCDNKVPYVFARQIMKYFYETESYSLFFEKILNILKPEIVLLFCYYVPISMGLSKACRQLGIPCVECQHGHQDWPHMAYNFPIMPANGWETVPEWFFMWGNKPANNMANWMANQNFHKIALYGNPQYNAWKNGEILEDPGLIEELEKRIHGRIPVGVALPLSFPENKIGLLREMILKSPKDWIWLLRRHPSYKRNEPSEEIEAIRDLGDRVEYDLSTRINLHELLSRSRHFVVARSSTAYEAVSLHGLHCTTVTEAGKKGFFIEIEEKNMEYASNVEDALKSITRGIAGYPWKPYNPYINPDASLIWKAIKTVLR